MYFVYIIYSTSHDRYYIGQTNNINKRLERHNKKIVRSTKTYAPWEIKWSKEFESRSQSVIEEKKLKSFKNRNYLLKYCGENDYKNYLKAKL